MRTVVIGDIHARNVWKKIVEKEAGKADHIIFIGDYFDTYDDVSTEKQIENFKSILRLKDSLQCKVTLLIGNHDYHYLGFGNARYSGYQEEDALKIRKILKEAIMRDKLKICVFDEGYLISHAGFTSQWCDRYKVNTPQDINNLFSICPEAFAFCKEDTSGFGEHPLQGPLWVRPKTLNAHRLLPAMQIVGHTHSNPIHDKGPVCFIDCFDEVEEYLVIGDGLRGVEKVGDN